MPIYIPRDSIIFVKQIRKSSYEWAYQYISSHYGSKIHHIGLLAENHTSNLYYWDNVYWIKQLLCEAGYKVSVLIPKMHKEKFIMKSASGFQIEISPLHFESGGKLCTGFPPRFSY